MIGSYHVVVARIVSKESVGIKYCLTTKAYLEYLQAILTLIPPPKEDITCLSEAVKTLINKVI